MHKGTIEEPAGPPPTSQSNRASKLFVALRVLLAATIASIAGTAVYRISIAPAPSLVEVAPAASSVAAFAAVWVALEGLERQRRSGAEQRTHLERQIVASEATARAAGAAARVTVARLREDRLEQLARVEGQCNAVADRIQAVLNHGIMRAGWSPGAGAPPPTSGQSGAGPAVSLHLELRACAASLSAVLPASGVLDPRHIRAVAAAIVALEGGADRLERGTPVSDAGWRGVSESATGDAVGPVVSDLHSVAAAARSERERLKQEPGFDV
jgi:hypothetical protein